MCHVCLSRRRLFSGLGGIAAMTAIGAMTAGPASAQPARSAETPDAALARLMEGNARYAAGKLSERDYSVGRVARSQGQAPFAAILGCADSRVAA
jgi:carbonic anhydrase